MDYGEVLARFSHRGEGVDLGWKWFPGDVRWANEQRSVLISEKEILEAILRMLLPFLSSMKDVNSEAGGQLGVGADCRVEWTLPRRCAEQSVTPIQFTLHYVPDRNIFE